MMTIAKGPATFHERRARRRRARWASAFRWTCVVLYVAFCLWILFGNPPVPWSWQR